MMIQTEMLPEVISNRVEGTGYSTDATILVRDFLRNARKL